MALDTGGQILFIGGGQNMKATIINRLCSQRVTGFTSMWHRATGIVGRGF